MISLFFRKISHYRKQYGIKTIVFFLLFVSIHVIGLFAASFASQNYHASGNYISDVYYSTRWTILNNQGMAFIRDNYEEEDYCLVFSVDTKREGNCLRFTVNFEGNALRFGFGYEDLYAVPIQDSIQKTEQIDRPIVIVSENFSDDSVVWEGKTLPITYKTRFSLPNYLSREFSAMGVERMEFVMVERENETDGIPEFCSVHSSKSAALERMDFKLGKDLNASYDVSLGGISTLVYAVFGIVYFFALVFWTTLIRTTDIISRRELELFRSFGYPRGKAFGMFLTENLLLMLPCLALSDAIFIPIFYFLFRSRIAISLFLSFFAAFYVLCYCLWYSNVTVRSIYVSKGGRKR